MNATATGHSLHLLAGAVLFGSAGLLVGARLDFGPLGIATLADLCSVELPSSLDTLRYRATSAPWSYVGMLVGCNLAMLLSAPPAGRARAAGSMRVLRFATCNAGMVFGMCLVEVLSPGLVPGAGSMPATARMLLYMVPGMVAGMLGAWSCLEWMQRAWRCAQSDFALRHAPPLAGLNPGAGGRRSGCDGNR